MTGPLFLVEGLEIVRPGFRLSVDRLSIPAGRPTLILGPTASGKTTLLTALARLEAPWLEAPGGTPVRGRILFDRGDGEPLDLLALSERRLNALRIRGAEIGYVPQKNGLFTGLTVTENVAWPLRRAGLTRTEAEARAAAALERTDGPPAAQSVARLSGGESKRLAVARALAHSPRALLMDEPFTGLDPIATKKMIGLTRDLAPDVTPIVVTHRQRAVKALAGRVVFVRKDETSGEIEWAGEASGAGDRIDRFLSEAMEEIA